MSNNKKELTTLTQEQHSAILQTLAKLGLDQANLDELSNLLSQPVELPLIHYMSTHMLVESCKNGDLERVKMALELGAQVNENECFAAKQAVHKGHLHIVQFFIENQYVLPIYNSSLIKEACTWGHLSIVDYFTNQGFDLFSDNQEALRYACFSGRIDIVIYLLQRGGDKDIAQQYINDSVKEQLDKYLNALSLHEELNQKLKTKRKKKNKKHLQDCKNKI